MLYTYMEKHNIHISTLMYYNLCIIRIIHWTHWTYIGETFIYSYWLRWGMADKQSTQTQDEYTATPNPYNNPLLFDSELVLENAGLSISIFDTLTTNEQIWFSCEDCIHSHTLMEILGEALHRGVSFQIVPSTELGKFFIVTRRVGRY